MSTPAVEVVALASLRPHPRNYRVHPDDQLAHLAASIQAHGVYRNIVIARDGTILAGHGVSEAAKRAGLATVPVVRLDLAPDDPRALKVLAGDNEVTRIAEVDDRALSEILKEINDTDYGLLGTGYDEMMLANLAMVTRPESEIRNIDEAAEWVGMPDYSPAPVVFKLVVSFTKQSDFDDLVNRLGLRLGKGGRSAWWPPRDREDLASVKFDE